MFTYTVTLTIYTFLSSATALPSCEPGKWEGSNSEEVMTSYRDQMAAFPVSKHTT